MNAMLSLFSDNILYRVGPLSGTAGIALDEGQEGQ
jgi:hypothetical protein